MTSGVLRAKGKRRIPIAPLDYVDGGTDAKTSMARVTETCRDEEFRPSAVRDMEKAALSSRNFGRPVRMPATIANRIYETNAV